MTTINKALFSMGASPAADRRYNAASAEVITVQLESPVGVQLVRFEVFDQFNLDSPLATKDAPDLLFANGFASITLNPANQSTSITMVTNTTETHSWMVRATAVTDSGTHVFERVLTLRNGLPRKPLPGESTQAQERGWADDWADLVDYAAAGGGGGGGGGGPSAPAPYLVATSDIALTGNVVVDGVATNTLPPGSRVLPTAQAAPAENGPWVINNAGAWTRPSDYDADADVAAALGIVSGAVIAGTLGAGTVWFQSAGLTIAGSKTWTKLATPSLLQDARSATLAAQILTQHKGVALLPDGANGRNTIDYDRADVREYGANVGGTQYTTATGTAASAAITLAAAKNYRNGNWLMLSGLGAAHGMATPGAPTLAVQGVTGASTISVKVVALTSTGGYTPASTATTVTTANATLDTSNFVEVWCAPVASAYRYLIYVQFGGVGNYVYMGGVIAHPQYDAIGRAEPCTFRIKTSTPAATPGWLPSTAPATGVANGLRTQILTGGGTTAITVFPVPITSGAGVHCYACNLIPLEDAINSDPDYYSTEIRIPRGTLYLTGPLAINSPTRITGANCGGPAAGSVLQFRDGRCPSTYNTKGAEQWQPGTMYRLRDRVVSQLRTGINGCWMLTAVAAGATWGVSGTVEPTWNYTPGATTTDNGHTWTFQAALTGSAAGCRFQNLRLTCEGSTIPASRMVVEDDLRVGVQFLSGGGGQAQVWETATTPALNVYWVPTTANATGKMYQATAVVGATGGAEPAWPKVIGATVVDGGVTWTCVDVLRWQGSGLTFTTVTHCSGVQVDGFCGTGILGAGSTSGSGTAVSRSTFRDMDVRNNRGHHIALFGSDASACSFRDVTLGLRVNATDGSCTVQDNGFYGNRFENLVHDGRARFQNQPWVNSVQRMSVLDNCYTEGLAGSDTDWNRPGCVETGHHAYGFRVGSTALLNGVAPSTSDLTDGIDSARLEYDNAGIGLSRQLTGGLERKFFGSGTVAAGTLLQEQHEQLLTTKGRTKHTVYGTTSVRETAHYDARGPGEVFPQDLRVCSRTSGTIGVETRLGVLYAYPTKDVYNAGDFYTWGLDNRRLSIRPARAGGLGAVARVNGAAHVQGDIISTSSKHFVCVRPGTLAGSLPAGYAAATIGTYITDGTALFQMWTIAQDPNLTAAPNLWADPIAVTDLDQTIQFFLVNDGQPCRDMPAATANRIITLGVSGMIAGDCYMLRQMNNVAFTITINTVDGGSVVMPASTRCWTVIKMTRAGTFTQHSSGLYL